MKKIVFIAIAAIALTTAAQAQDSTAAHKMKMERGDKMQHAPMYDQLNLTQDQKDKMKKLHEDSRTKMDAISNDKSLSDEQRQAKMKDLRMDQRKSMEAVLTDEQKTKMKQMREERKEMKAGSDSTMRR